MNNRRDEKDTGDLPSTLSTTADLEEGCATCRFWDLGNARQVPGAGAVSRCRRFPPGSTMLLVPSGAPPPVSKRVQLLQDMRNEPQLPQLAVQPFPCISQTQGIDWCGEFSARR